MTSVLPAAGIAHGATASTRQTIGMSNPPRDTPRNDQCCRYAHPTGDVFEMTDSTRGVSDELVHRLRAAGCVFAEDEAALLIDAATTSEELQRLVNLRVAGEPLEHLLGWVEFDGLRL